MLIKNICIVFFMFFSITLCAKNIFTVEDIQFKGLRKISHNEVLKNIVFGVGSTVSEYDIKNSIQSLFKTGKFEDIVVVCSGKNIIFNIRERPIISDVTIVGSNIIKNDILNEYLRKLNIKKDSPFNTFLIEIFVKEIKKFYKNHGRYKSNVKILKNFLNNNNISLKILINEGVPTKVNSIKIFGIKDFSEEKIMSLFKSKDHHSWWNILDKSNYSPIQLDHDLDNLNNFYLNQGYFYFNINNKKVDFIRNKNRINIIVNVSEGQKYRIANFTVNGDLFPYKKSITDCITINNNELYNKEKINLIVNRIKRFLSENGYIDAQIIVEPIVNHDNKAIILNFNIDMKQRFFVRRIHFMGNELTQDKVLRREIKQMEGNYFNINLVELGKKSLEKTKYFSVVEVINNINSDHSNQVDIFYKVKEQSTGSINFGLGYGVDSGISFNTSFSQENIFGSGNSFKSSIIKNNNQKHVDVSISYPYFMFDAVDLNARLFYNDLKYNFNNVSNVTKKTYGFEGNLGFLINDRNKINWGLGYTHNGIDNRHKQLNVPFSTNQSLDTVFLKNNSVNDFTINYSWIYDNLEYIYFPVAGDQIFINGKNTLPGSDNNFYKITLDNQKYIPLNVAKDFIFLSRIHMGIGNSFNKELFPFYENFYASTMNNIRGFRANTIGPKTIYNSNNLKKCIGYKNNNICESIDSVGGNTAFISNLELIMPIPFIKNKYSQFLRGSLFLDAGNIWNTNLSDITNINSLNFSANNPLKNIYSSFGLSLQWFSPIGPVFFSYALPIHKHNNYQLEPFQFNFGKNW